MTTLITAAILLPVYAACIARCAVLSRRERAAHAALHASFPWHHAP
jgi:hypothetical protein